MNFRTEDDVVHRKYLLYINKNNATLECNPTKTLVLVNV